MGMFSWICRQCEHPIASPFHITQKNAWLNDVTVVDEDGEVDIIGEYDGYGRVGEKDVYAGGIGAPELYHSLCYLKEGPTKKRGPSESDPFQGMCPPDIGPPE